MTSGNNAARRDIVLPASVDNYFAVMKWLTAVGGTYRERGRESLSHQSGADY